MKDWGYPSMKDRTPRAVALVIVMATLFLGACSVIELRPRPRYCTLEPYRGTLEPVSGGVRFTGGRWGPAEVRGVEVLWPDGYSTRTADGGTVEILDRAGVVVARTGEPVALFAATESGSADMWQGKFVVCDTTSWPTSRPATPTAVPSRRCGFASCRRGRRSRRPRGQ